MLDNEIRIAEKTLKNFGKPYIIAEAGSNHGQSLDTALRLIDIAADAGADAVKFQLFLADALYPPGTKMHGIFKSMELDAAWLPKLAGHARARGLHFLASPFDRQSVDTLKAAGVPAMKVASSETTNLPLLAHIARQGLPILLSTGMCDLADVAEAVEVCESSGNREVALLQCGALYPLPPEQVHLRAMDSFRRAFSCPIGYSDHTLGMAAVVGAVARGACVIEKHFTFDRKADGPDHFYALEPGELKTLVALAQEAHLCLGSSEKRMLDEERKVGRRDGLYAAKSLATGQSLAEDAIVEKRPALGIRARYRRLVEGARLRNPAAKDEPLQWDHLEF